MLRQVSSVYGILQARILEWVANSPPGDSPGPGTKSTSLISPTLTDTFFTTSLIWEASSIKRSSHFVFPLAEQHSVVKTHHIFFIHSTVNGHLACF